MNRRLSARLLWQLFVTLLKVGAFTFGGGYAMIPLVHHELVVRREWLGDEEFVDCLTVAQTAPGAIAVNTAAVVGCRLGGLTGAAVAALGASLPSFAVLILVGAGLSMLTGNVWVDAIFRGVRPAVAALIIAAALRLGQRSVQGLPAALIFLGSLVGVMALGWHPVPVLVAAAVAGAVVCRREVSE